MKRLILNIALLLITTGFLVNAGHANTWTDQDISLVVLTENIKPGETFQVKVVSDVSMDSKAWVGVFERNLDHQNPSGYKNYIYVGDHNGKARDLVAPTAAGEYELRLYAADPGKFIKAINFRVVKVTPDQYSITIHTDKINPSGEIAVKLETTYEADARSWLGIFKADRSTSSASGYESYFYVDKPFGKDFIFTAPAEAGDYEFRFYSADPGQLIDRVPFRIGKPDLPGIAFSLDKATYGPTEKITVTYTGHQDLAKTAWIGFFNETAEKNTYRGYFDYQYLKPKEKGELIFTAPATKGNYQARMFYAETGPQLLESVAFGITSSLDNTLLKKTLDEKGKVTLYGIYFDTDKSIVKPESYPLIEQIAKMLDENRAVRIQIAGHTDSEGEDTYNQQLSQKRAEAVGKILIEEFHVSKLQLEFKGFGESKPIGNNETAQGRAKNRRVELKKL